MDKWMEREFVLHQRHEQLFVPVVYFLGAAGSDLREGAGQGSQASRQHILPTKSFIFYFWQMMDVYKDKGYKSTRHTVKSSLGVGYKMRNCVTA